MFIDVQLVQVLSPSIIVVGIDGQRPECSEFFYDITRDFVVIILFMFVQLALTFSK
jgi:hypothetical protein